MIKKASLILTAIVNFCAAAHAGELYKCTAGGHVSFQDQPCAGARRDENTVVLKPDTVSSEAVDSLATEQWLEQRDRDERRQNIENQIHRLEADSRSAGTLNEISHSIANAERSSANNNLAGAVYRASVSVEEQTRAAEISDRQRRNDVQIQELRRQLDDVDKK